MPACPHLHSGNGAATTSESGYCEFVCSERGTVPGPLQMLQNISSDGHECLPPGNFCARDRASSGAGDRHKLALQGSMF